MVLIKLATLHLAGIWYYFFQGPTIYLYVFLLCQPHGMLEISHEDLRSEMAGEQQCNV